MPLPRRRIKPARSISRWLTSSASDGASLRVERKNFDTRMTTRNGGKPLFYRTPVFFRKSPGMKFLQSWRIRKPADDNESVYISEKFGVRTLHIGSDTVQSSMRIARPY